MIDRLARLEARVEQLTLVVEELAGRLRALEGEGARESWESAAAMAPAEPPVAVVPTPEPPAAERWGPVALLGRTLMVLGGAYLFRALTESGALPALAGVGLGLAYALLWLWLADRAAVAGRRLSASFHGAAFALIAAPLAWEAASRFEVFSATEGSATLAALTGAALAVAWRRDLRSVAWLASLAALLSAWAFMGSVAPVIPAACVLVLVAVADDWVARARGWLVLSWVSAAAADLTLAFMAMGELLGEGAAVRPGQGYGLAALLLGHFVLFAGSAALRAAGRGWRVRWFDLFQLPAAALVGYGGAFLLARRLPPLALGLGLGSVLVGLAALEVTRRLFERRAEHRHAYVFFAWTGLVLILGGSALLVPPAGRAVAWAAAAVVLAWIASRRHSVTLGLHAWVSGTAAAVASGLLVYAAYAFAASAEGPWVPLRPASWLVLLALAVAASLDLPAESPFWSRVETRAVKLMLLAVLAWGAFGVACGALAHWLAGAPGAGAGAPADPAALALLRMGVVAAAALLLGWLGRFRRYREAAWLVYPVLVLGAFKLVLEDFLLGRAAELFGALALYGAVLILAPRLARASQARSSGEVPARSRGGKLAPRPPARGPAS
jgi:hypothetical protein